MSQRCLVNHSTSTTLRLYSTADANQMFIDAKSLNMTGSGYVWIVTEQALRSENVPEGTMGLTLVGAGDERGHISDSL